MGLGVASDDIMGLAFACSVPMDEAPSRKDVPTRPVAKVATDAVTTVDVWTIVLKAITTSKEDSAGSKRVEVATERRKLGWTVFDKAPETTFLAGVQSPGSRSYCCNGCSATGQPTRRV
jgi:hypothetical protein